MAEGAKSSKEHTEYDKGCCEVFGLYVEKVKAKACTAQEKKTGNNSVMKKIVKDSLKLNKACQDVAETSIFPKCSKAKTISDKAFVDEFMPLLAERLLKEGKVKGDLDSVLLTWKKTMSEDKATLGGEKKKDAAVVSRLTDTKGYTGSHAQRFGVDGKGKGLEGREDLHTNDGYVGGYKNKDTYEEKK